MGASVRQRLLNRAREERLEFGFVVRRYLFERFLARLGRSSVNERFVLKGAMLLQSWFDRPFRATMDLDLARRASFDRDAVLEDIAQICVTPFEDGVVFDATRLDAEEIRGVEEYGGLRIFVPAVLDTIRERLQIDVGFGDVIWPEPVEGALDSMIEDFESPRVLTYTPESVVAEKLEAIVTLGIRGSRIKDHFDVDYLASSFEFDGERLAEAIRRTFERRGTGLPESLPIGLTEEYWAAPARHVQLEAFVRRARVEVRDDLIATIRVRLATFLWPLLEALRDRSLFSSTWQPGGPWTKRS
jgi:hypothetical protein